MNDSVLHQSGRYGEEQMGWTYPIINFILPFLAASTRMGTNWGSLGPKMPWGRMAMVKKFLSGSLASKTACRRETEGVCSMQIPGSEARQSLTGSVPLLGTEWCTLLTCKPLDSTMLWAATHISHWHNSEPPLYLTHPPQSANAGDSWVKTRQLK